MKVRIKRIACLFIVCLLIGLTGCGEVKQDNLIIGALKGPTALGMLKWMEEAGAMSIHETSVVKETNGRDRYDYQFTVSGTADELAAGLVKGEIVAAAVPCNLASVLYNKTEGNLICAAINTGCVLYVVETGDSIRSVEDLRGRTVYSTGKGTTPEYTLNYLLAAAGIDPDKDLTIEYKSEAAEVAAILADSENAVAMLPQPYVTVAGMQNERLRIAFGIAEEWEKNVSSDSGIVTGVFVINKEFADKYPEAVRAMLHQYEESVSYVTAHTDEAAQLAEKYDIVKAGVAKKALPYCDIMFVQGEEMKQRVQAYLAMLYSQNPVSIGGKMPEDEFYFILDKPDTES